MEDYSLPIVSGNITVVKDAIPNDLADFNFTSTISGTANFQLDDDTGVVGGTNTLLNSTTSTT